VKRSIKDVGGTHPHTHTHTHTNTHIHTHIRIHKYTHKHTYTHTHAHTHTHTYTQLHVSEVAFVSSWQPSAEPAAFAHDIGWDGCSQ